MTTVYHRDSLIAAMVVFLVLDGLAVGARVFVRTKLISRGFGLDDAMLCLTYAGFMVTCGMGWTAMYYGYAAPEPQPWHNKAKLTQFYFGEQLTIYISAGLVKLAVALVLLRIATTRPLRWLLWTSMVVVVVWTIVMTLFTSWLCAAKGTSNYAGSETCKKVGTFRTTTNILIDYFFALLPMHMLWKVQMSLRLKLTAMLLLGLGIFASTATIVKLAIVIRLGRPNDKETEAALHYDLLLWADIELGLAILAASLAALRPLLQTGLGRRLRAATGPGPGAPAASASAGPYQEFSDLDRRSRKTPAGGSSAIVSAVSAAGTGRGGGGGDGRRDGTKVLLDEESQLDGDRDDIYDGDGNGYVRVTSKALAR